MKPLLATLLCALIQIWVWPVVVESFESSGLKFSTVITALLFGFLNMAALAHYLVEFASED